MKNIDLEVTPKLSTLNQVFWAPKEPVKALYSIDLEIDPSKDLLEGEEKIGLVNKTSKPLSRFTLDWKPGKSWDMKVNVQGRPLNPLSNEPMLFELPEPLKPEERTEISVGFSFILPKEKCLKLRDFHPRLWWGYPEHDDFLVKVKVPKDYELVTSGLLDEPTGRYVANGVKNFGVVVAEGFLTAEGRASGVSVKALFTEIGRRCAEILLNTALDAVEFYEGMLGFYPQPVLSIIPGVEMPAGGYPFATNIIAIHGLERFGERPLDWWKWITAHEIGHQYFGEYVLEGDKPEWLWVGLGIYLDREYSRARRLDPETHRRVIQRYVEGVRQGFDTTIERPSEQLATIGFDFNNVVIHGKGFSIISALEVVIGKETLLAVYNRIFSNFKGRRLKASKFQEICEEESKQDLDWFFRQWLHTNGYLSYEMASIERAYRDERDIALVRVKRLGRIEMPIPVEARFEDGSVERKITDRVLLVNALEFQSKARLTDVRLDPDSLLPLVYPPPEPSEIEVAREVDELPWVRSGEKAKEVYERACKTGLKLGALWLKIGLTLYDGEFYDEALEAFKRMQELCREPTYLFAAMVWQGHVLDLLERRDEALKFYQKAKEVDIGEDVMRHDQYGLVINKKWVEERLKSPFQRTDRPRLPKPTQN